MSGGMLGGGAAAPRCRTGDRRRGAVRGISPVSASRATASVRFGRAELRPADRKIPGQRLAAGADGTETGIMQLLERQSPLAELARFAQEARNGNGRLVLLAGEAGVGKTALIEQLQRDIPDARWSWGACDGLFTPGPLGPLLDLADQFGGELPGLCRTDAAREEFFAALLRRIGEPVTLDAVVVEDVHWADEATVDLLRFLGRRLKGKISAEVPP